MPSSVGHPHPVICHDQLPRSALGHVQLDLDRAGDVARKSMFERVCDQFAHQESQGRRFVDAEAKGAADLHPHGVVESQSPRLALPNQL